MSRRQAYRYIEAAKMIAYPAVVADPAAEVTFKLPSSLVDTVRARPVVEGVTISDTVSRALRPLLGDSGNDG